MREITLLALLRQHIPVRNSFQVVLDAALMNFGERENPTVLQTKAEPWAQIDTRKYSSEPL